MLEVGSLVKAKVTPKGSRKTEVPGETDARTYAPQSIRNSSLYSSTITDSIKTVQKMARP